MKLQPNVEPPSRSVVATASINRRPVTSADIFPRERRRSGEKHREICWSKHATGVVSGDRFFCELRPTDKSARFPYTRNRARFVRARVRGRANQRQIGRSSTLPRLTSRITESRKPLTVTVRLVDMAGQKVTPSRGWKMNLVEFVRFFEAYFSKYELPILDRDGKFLENYL